MTSGLAFPAALGREAVVKLLFLSWNYLPVIGGIEDVVAHLVAGFRERADELELVTAGCEQPEDDPQIHRPDGMGLKACLRFAFFRGWSLNRRTRFDLMVCPSIPTALPAWLLSLRFGVPFVLLMHGTDIKKEGWLYQRVVRFLMTRATLLAAASHNTGRLLVEAGADPEKVVAIHPGVDLETWAERPAAADALYPERSVMLSVGRLIKRKGILEFVEHSLPELVREQPDLLYAIVGGDATQSLAHNEPMRARIEAVIATKQLQEHVVLLGKVPYDQLKALLHRADVFVLPGLDLPNDAEGFGIVFNEAALCHTPAVATRVGGMPEAVAHEVSGLLAEPGDYADLNTQLLRILQNSELKAQLARDGAERAKNEFAWPVVLDRYEALFRRAISARRGSN